MVTGDWLTDQGWLIRTALTALTRPSPCAPSIGGGGGGGGTGEELSRAGLCGQADTPLGWGGRPTGAGVAGGSRGRGRVGWGWCGGGR